MRVLHCVAADRWTGAAATALQAVEALRAAGHDARLAFRPGRNLSERLGAESWAHPALPKERSLGDIRASVARIRDLAADCDVVHVHLPHDHLVATLALAREGPALIRSIHHPNHLRADPFHRVLFRRCGGVGLANSAMSARVDRLLGRRHRPVRVLPVALEPRFVPGGDRFEVRRRLGIPDDATVVGTIGKLDPSRGQDLFVRALAAAPDVWGMIIGKGPFEPALRRLASELGVAERLAFAGYVEAGLEHHYAAMDMFVFPAAGSDWAHRAVAEASGCGRAVLAADLDGIRDVVVPGETGLIYPRHDAAALAVQIRRWVEEPTARTAAGAAGARLAARAWTPARLALACEELYALAAGAAAEAPKPSR